MTNAFNAQFDAMALPAFKGAGLADDGLYTPANGGPAIPCAIYIDRSVTLTGADSQVINGAFLITAFAADVGACPKRGARFQSGTETFTVDGIQNKDESRYVCVVKAGV